MSTKNKIKLYGFGVVGQGFQSYLANNEDAERLHTIIVKDDTKHRKTVPSIIETTNKNTVRDKDMEVIVELISSADEAYGIVAENLEIGKRVISANKKLIAENLAEFIKLENENDGSLLYEGAVCGSIPIVRVLNDLFSNEAIASIEGIFNGSSNYILSKIFNENLSYGEALGEAQHLGFAEADPTSDVGGFDALYKLIIVAAHGFGKVLKPEQVLNIGIENISIDDVEFAKTHGLKIKLIAKAEATGNKINLSVLPTLINADSELFNVENEYNGVEIKGKNIGTHFYKGKGAGSYPTGAVVYSDLNAIDRNYRYGYKKLEQNKLIYENDKKVTVILGLKESISIKSVEQKFSNLYPLDLFGKRFIAKIGLRELQEIKYELQSNEISLVALQDDELIEELTQSLKKGRGINIIDMKSFRTETENILSPEVEKDIIELGQKIFEYKNGKLPEDKFKSLRLARGVYGQRQLGVQMIRIKLPYGKLLHQQLTNIANVSDKYSNGNLHLTTRQDVQIHYVSLDKTPQLWEELEQDQITLREACGNTVRNITASPYAGIDPEEPFDVSPYADALFRYLLRNPVNQDLGRKIKISFSSSDADTAFSFLHDLGFIPKIVDNVKGFKLLIGGGLGVKPFLAKVAKEFIAAEEIFSYTLAVLRVFDRYGERQKRNKARLKYLIDSIGIDSFLSLVDEELKVVEQPNIDIIEVVEPKLNSVRVAPITNVVDVNDYLRWYKTNIYHQKQSEFYTIQLKITNGNIKSSTARKLAKLVGYFSNGELRVTINQGLIIKYVRKDSLPYLYEELKKLELVAPGFDSVADITSCPGTDTCNLGIANSTKLAQELEFFIQQHHSDLISNKDIKIKISGCFNACGQHSIANIGFHGSTLKKEGKLIPAVQLLLGGGVVGNGGGIIAEKIIKLPTKRAVKAVDILLKDYNKNGTGLLFNQYFHKFGNHYFYDLLKGLANEEIIEDEYLDWGQKQKFAMNIGVGECAGVTIDLAQVIQFEIDEKIELAQETIDHKLYADSVYHSYNVFVHSAKLLLLKNGIKYNSQKSVIDSASVLLKELDVELESSFSELVLKVKSKIPNEKFALGFFEKAIDFNGIINKIITTKPTETADQKVVELV